MKRLPVLVLFLALLSTGAHALDVGSDGSDGALNVNQNTVIGLRLATTGSWDTPGSGNGVYDPEKWAVVFKYSSVNIASGRTVTFINNHADAPVVWLVQGCVTIAGTISVNGQGHQTGGVKPLPGPGGFRGGKGWQSALLPGAAGLGPGGGGYRPGIYNGGAGSYATHGTGTDPGGTYGNARILPLIGGSGGAGAGDRNHSGGGGGGAILIASNGTIHSPGSITALGSNSDGYYGGGGSGGAIRLIANAVTGYAGGLQAVGTANGECHVGGNGRIRIEANSVDMSGTSNPAYSPLVPLDNDTAVIWPPAGSPELRVTSIAGQPVPADPQSEFDPPGDVALSTDPPVNVDIEATGMPIDWLVQVRVVLKAGDEYFAGATYVDGDSVSSRWSATLQPIASPDFIAVQARASKP